MGDLSVWVAAPLGVAVRHVICGFNYLFIIPPGYFALWDSKAHHRPTRESVSWCLETSLFFKTPFPGRISVPTSFVSLYLLYFVLPPFEDNGLPFWVPDVLFQHSEVVLWNLLNIQMFFWWICGGESGLHVLFLLHLQTTTLLVNFDNSYFNRCDRITHCEFDLHFYDE